MKARLLLCYLLVALLIMLLLTSCGQKKPDLEDYFEDIQIPEIEYRDAEAYYKENGELLDSVDAENSNIMLSEAEAIAELSRRGFGECEVVTYYDVKGNYIGETACSPSSKNKHPVYEVEYASPDGMPWILSVIGDAVVANPVYYNYQSTKGVMTVIVETDTVTSYDGITNRFFVTIPSESALIMKRVDRIDAETLDAMTMEELDG